MSFPLLISRCTKERRWERRRPGVIICSVARKCHHRPGGWGHPDLQLLTLLQRSRPTTWASGAHPNHPTGDLAHVVIERQVLGAVDDHSVDCRSFGTVELHMVESERPLPAVVRRSSSGTLAA